MLTYLLAFAIAIASIGLYAMTFFLPAFKREQDLIWSGVGLFYALVLWACAGQVRGGLLLGQMASVALLGWLGWQAFGARWAGLSDDDKAQAKVLTDIKEKFDRIDFGNLGDQAKGLVDKAKSSTQNLTDKAKDAAGNAQNLASKAKETTASVKEKAASVTEKTKAAATTVAEKTKETAATVSEKTQEAKAAVTEKASETKAEVQEAAKEVKETAKEVRAEVTEADTPKLKKPNTSAAKAREATEEEEAEAVETEVVDEDE